MVYIQSEVRGKVGVVTIDRPEKHNAMDLTAYEELCEALAKLGREDQVQVVVVRSSGADFCIGEDFEYLALLSREGKLRRWREGYRGFVHVTWHLPKILIAEVRGRALGVGCELALLCDVTYASEGAVFGHPEIAIGIATPSIWPWLAGPKVAKEYLASGRLMEAREAVRVGLINRVFGEAELSSEVELLANDFASMPLGTPASNKRVLNWAFRDVSRVLLDDLAYEVDFDWLVANRDIDAEFYESVQRLGFDEALRRRNERFARS